MRKIVKNILLICLIAIGMVLFANIDVHAAESQVIPDYEDGMSASAPVGNYQYWISKNRIVKHDIRIDDIDKREQNATVVVKPNVNEIIVCAMIHDKAIFYATKKDSGVERTVYQYDIKQKKAQVVGSMDNVYELYYHSENYVYGLCDTASPGEYEQKQLNLKTGKSKVFATNSFIHGSYKDTLIIWSMDNQIELYSAKNNKRTKKIASDASVHGVVNTQLYWSKKVSSKGKEYYEISRYNLKSGKNSKIKKLQADYVGIVSGNYIYYTQIDASTGNQIFYRLNLSSRKAEKIAQKQFKYY